MELRQLRIFLAVADAGSFSKAAAMLSTSQPILSRQIKALEQELGIDLFFRNGRGILLTEAGRVLANHARTAIESVTHAIGDLKALHEIPTGDVVIGVPPTVSSVLSVPLVRQFKTEFPRMSLRIVEGFSGFVTEWLATGRLDVGVIYDAARTSTLITEHIQDEQLYLFGPVPDPADLGDSGPVSLNALGDLPLVLPGKPHGLRTLVDTTLSAHRVTARVTSEIDSLPAILALVQQGVGYTILPYAPVHDSVSAGRVRLWTIGTPGISRSLSLATTTSRVMTPATRALAKMVRTQIRSLAAGGQWSPSPRLIVGDNLPDVASMPQNWKIPLARALTA